MVMDEMNNTTSTVRLEDLNDQYAMSNIGGIVFVGIMMIIGVTGNAHVLYIYAFRFKPSNHRIYILFMASVDLITCCIGMPFVIFDLRNPLMFDAVRICKSLRFLNYFMVIGSMLTLVVMAVDRYKSICRPFGKQMTTKTAKYACVLSLIISVCLSWPAPVLYGRSTVDAKLMTSYFNADYNITGTHCYTEDRFKKTKYQAYFNTVLIAVYIILFFVLCIMYGLIAREIAKNSALFASENSGESIKISAITDVHTGEKKTKNELKGQNTYGNVKLTSFYKHVDKQTELKQNTKRINGFQKNEKKNWRENQSKNITVILAIITIVFLLSYTPHLCMKIIAMLNPNFFTQLSRVELFLYNTFVWSFFISNMANPIIYGFCLSKFRKEVYLLYTRRKKKDEATRSETRSETIKERWEDLDKQIYRSQF